MKMLFLLTMVVLVNAFGTINSIVWSLNTLQPLNNQVIGDSIINGLRPYPSVWRTFLNNIEPLTH